MQIFSKQTVENMNIYVLCFYPQVKYCRESLKIVFLQSLEIVDRSEQDTLTGAHRLSLISAQVLSPSMRKYSSQREIKRYVEARISCSYYCR